MLGREEGGLKRVPCPSYNTSVAAAATVANTFTVAEGHVMTSQYISQLDEAARRRLERMNEKLRGLEMQMEAFEAEMNKANAGL